MRVFRNYNTHTDFSVSESEFSMHFATLQFFLKLIENETIQKMIKNPSFSYDGDIRIEGEEKPLAPSKPPQIAKGRLFQYIKQPDIYEANEDNTARFALGVSGSNTVLVFGIHPSTANEVYADQTLNNVQKYAYRQGFDSFVMLNLYPQRARDISCLPPTKEYPKENLNLINENIAAIEAVLSEIKGRITIWAAWGSNFPKRKYLKTCLKRIADATNKYDCTWKCIGTTVDGHPKNPCIMASNPPFIPFDIDEYI
jgi:hypothetical protein